MSGNPRTGVVDATCRVHGIANLYIAGSLVPEFRLRQPHADHRALALRLGDELRRQLA